MMSAFLILAAFFYSRATVLLHVIRIWQAGKFASSTQAFEEARPMMEHIELIAALCRSFCTVSGVSCCEVRGSYR